MNYEDQSDAQLKSFVNSVSRTQYERIEAALELHQREIINLRQN